MAHSHIREILTTPILAGLHMTTGALAALSREGNKIWHRPSGLYDVLLSRPPLHLEVVKQKGLVSLRLHNERPFLGEVQTTPTERGVWVPCPECGRTLLPYETGFVPGYRICLGLHHVQLSLDGKQGVYQNRQGLLPPDTRYGVTR